MSKDPRKATAIVLARGGSKGLPRKNAAVIAGKPCLAWTLEDALRSTRVARVALSTDDPELSEIARRLGVGVVDRPAELASDRATVDDAARHAACALGVGAHENVVILYGNVPIRPPGLIDRALELLITSGCDSVQSYAGVGKFHPWWTARVDERDGAVRPWEGEVLNHGVFRRQDLPPAFIPDGGVIALTRRALLLEIPGVPPGPHAFFGLHRRGVINPEGAVIDIDTEPDLALARAVLEKKQ